MTKLFEIGQKLTPRFLEQVGREVYFRLSHLIKRGTFDFFELVQVETTTVCNRRCSYCPNSLYERSLMKNKKQIKTELFKKIVDQLSELKFQGKFSPHFFGEPLLDKRLPDLITYTRKKLSKANIQIYTNGDFLSIELYKKLVNAGANTFVITQHSKDMPYNVKKVFNYRKINGDDNVYINYRFLKKDNLLNVGGLVKLKKLKKLKKCLLASRVLTIDYSGNILLCCSDYFSSIKLGNVNNENLIDIWNKESYKTLRKELRNGIFKLDKCKECCQKSGM